MLCAGGPAEGPGGGGGGAELPHTERAARQVPRLRAAQARPRGEQARRTAAPGRATGPPGHGNNNNNQCSGSGSTGSTCFWASQIRIH